MDTRSSSKSLLHYRLFRLLKDLFLIGRVDTNFLTTLEALCFSTQLTEKADSQKAFAKEVSQLIQIVITGVYTVSDLQFLDSL